MIKQVLSNVAGRKEGAQDSREMVGIDAAKSSQPL